MSLFVKLCGIRTAAELEVAVDAGADAVGFVLTPSPRQIPLAHAGRLLRMLPSSVLGVAVFHDPTPGLLRRTEAEVGPDLFQAERSKLSGVPPDKVFPVVVDRPDLSEAVDRALEATPRGMVLVDSAAKGGTGRHSNLDRLASIRSIDHVVIAGGLDHRNVGTIVARLGPGGVDVSSGIEREPGVKDPGRMREFVTAARAAEVAMTSTHGGED
ncbi:MAG TPA: phosphoribosylanthranilate isomerase [Acidimicrobiia bacterium]|jgi:phosphoribosylanthranilate isomerase